MGKKIKTRDINGNYVWLDLDTNKTTSVNSDVANLSTSVVKPKFIKSTKVRLKKKEYQPTLLGFASAIQDKIMGTDKVIDKGAEVKEDTRTPFERDLAYNLLHNNTPLGYVALTVVPAATAAAAITGVGSVITGLTRGASTSVPYAINLAKNVVATIPLAGATAEGVNAISEKVSGKSFDLLANEYTNGSIGYIFNPGYHLGGTAGKLTLDKYIMPRFRASMYKNVTPFGYDNLIEGDIPKSTLIKNMLKDAVNITKKIDTLAEPLWKTLLHGKEIFNNKKETPIWLDFRDEAYRKALLLPSKYPLYLDNGDGTWRYNSSYIKKRFNAILEPSPEEIKPVIKFTDKNGNVIGTENNFLSGDKIGHNGGFVNMVKNPNGTYTMNDVWDLHPFSDDRALFGIHFPGSKHIEGLLLLSGKPFTLKHTFTPKAGEIRYVKK